MNPAASSTVNSIVPSNATNVAVLRDTDGLRSRLYPSDIADSATERPVKRFRFPLVGRIGVNLDRNPAAGKTKGDGKARINRSIGLPRSLEFKLVDWSAQFRHE
jgi:hypothetical protein